MMWNKNKTFLVATQEKKISFHFLYKDESIQSPYTS